MSVHPAKIQISLDIRPVWSVFAVCMKKAWVLSYPLNALRRLWSDWAYAQADLSLLWAHTHFVGFVMSRLKCYKCCRQTPVWLWIIRAGWNYFLALVLWWIMISWQGKLSFSHVTQVFHWQEKLWSMLHYPIDLFLLSKKKHTTYGF